MTKSIKYIIILSICAMCILSCKKQAEPAFELEYPLTFEVKSGLSTFFIHVKLFSQIKSDLENQLNARGVKKETVSEILPFDMRLVSVDGREINYGKMNEIRVFITDGKPQGKRIEIGYVKPRLTETSNGIHLLPGIADVISYLEAETFDIELEINFREISSYSEQIIYVNFAVFTE